MSYELSFTDEFYTGTEQLEDIEITDKPTSVLQGIVSMYYNDKEQFTKMVKDVLHSDMPDFLPECLPYDILDKIRETNTCLNLNNPVSVFIDSEGFYTIEVYEG